MAKPARRRRVKQVPPVDRGTLEGQAKRAAIVGEADPALAAYPLGAMLAREIIDREQHDAGVRYARIRNAVFGAVWPSTNDARSPASDREAAKREREFRAMVGWWQPLAEWAPGAEPDQRYVGGLITGEQMAVLEAVAVHEIWPTWFFVRHCGLKELPEDEHERDLLLSGLAALLGRHQRHAA